MVKPIIIVEFHEGGCKWHSVGWGNNEVLKAKAKRLINEGKTPGEVLHLLKEGGFIITKVSQ